MADVDIVQKVGQLRFLLNALKLQKPEKSLRKRAGKKWVKVHVHYLELIEKVNEASELLKVSLQCLIETVELVIKDQGKEERYKSRYKKLRERVTDQDRINRELYESFKQITKLMEIAVSD